MRLTKLLPVVLLTIVGCTTSDRAATDPGDLGTATSELTGACSTETIYPIDWTGREPIVFPASVDHLENIQVRWDTNSFIAWGIGDGNVVTYSYRVKFTDQATFNKVVIDSMPTAAPGGTSSQTWGVQGVGGPCCSPRPGGPVGPGPIGFPPVYVKRLVQFAGTHTDTANFGNTTMGNYSIYGRTPATNPTTAPQ